MNHPSPEQLWLFRHDALEADEAAPMRAHLDAGCDPCEAALAGAETAAGTLALDADPREPDPGVRERLLDRVAGRPPIPLRVGARERVDRSWRIPAALAAGLVGAGIAIGAAATWFGVAAPQSDHTALAESERALAETERDDALAQLAEFQSRPVRDEALLHERDELRLELAREREALLDARAAAQEFEAEARSIGRSLARVENRLADREATTARLSAERDSLALALDAADAALDLLESPGVEWVVLSGEDDATQGAARFFWEWDRGDCLIDGGELPRLAEGQAYALWVAYERGAPELVTTFAPDANGSARLLARLPKGDGEVRSVRITLEDAQAPAAPEGETLLAGVLF